MEKYKNIKEYAEGTCMEVDDMKYYILRSCLELGCRVFHMDEAELQEAEHVFSVLDLFNNLLDNVE